MTSLVWLNGRIMPADEARIDPADRGVLLGDGLFETMRVSNGQVRWLENHLARLASGCVTLMLPCPPLDMVRQAVRDLLTACAATEGSMRLTVTRGCGPRGLLPPPVPHPTILLTCAPPAPVPGRPVRLGISRHIRDGLAPLTRVKTLNGLSAIMARMEAQAAGHDDALLPGMGGVVAEASAANVLLWRGNRLVTPPLCDGPLPGISRARLLEAGLCVEESVPFSTVDTVQAAWLVSALVLHPVASIGRHPLQELPEIDERLRLFLFGD